MWEDRWNRGNISFYYKILWQLFRWERLTGKFGNGKWKIICCLNINVYLSDYDLSVLQNQFKLTGFIHNFLFVFVRVIFLYFFVLLTLTEYVNFWLYTMQNGVYRVILHATFQTTYFMIFLKLYIYSFSHRKGLQSFCPSSTVYTCRHCFWWWSSTLGAASRGNNF